mmetsp:Transcript_125848/g.281185  ORF Transcript_125848/g.281185 Transcript_125848/m.281185 type:complete len:207 (-) Transcript_125848:613-1233(-)
MPSKKRFEPSPKTFIGSCARGDDCCAGGTSFAVADPELLPSATTSSSVALKRARLRSPCSLLRALAAAARVTPASHNNRIFSSSCSEMAPSELAVASELAAPATPPALCFCGPRVTARVAAVWPTVDPPRRRNSMTRSTSFTAFQSSSIHAFVFATWPAQSDASTRPWTLRTLRRGTTSSRFTTLTMQSSKVPMSRSSTQHGVPKP